MKREGGKKKINAAGSVSMAVDPFRNAKSTVPALPHKILWKLIESQKNEKFPDEREGKKKQKKKTVLPQMRHADVFNLAFSAPSSI